MTLNLLSSGQSWFSCIHDDCLYSYFCWREVVYLKRLYIFKNYLPSVFSTSLVRGNKLPRGDESKWAVFARWKEENYVTTIISVSCTCLEQVTHSIYISERLLCILLTQSGNAAIWKYPRSPFAVSAITIWPIGKMRVRVKLRRRRQTMRNGNYLHLLTKITKLVPS
jgi:hypothetical protein